MTFAATKQGPFVPVELVLGVSRGWCVRLHIYPTDALPGTSICYNSLEPFKTPRGRYSDSILQVQD
jgi:hypothetical protein